MTNLSPNFTLEELTVSQSAARLGLSNIPDPKALQNLTFTASRLEDVKKVLQGKPILVSSGYRSPAVNKAVGSKAKHSQHMDGEAVDFTAPRFGTPKEIVKAILASKIDFDQIIHEFDSWVHISFKKAGNRKQALVIDKSGTRLFS